MIGHSADTLRGFHARNEKLDSATTHKPRARQHHHKNAYPAPAAPAMSNEQAAHHNLSEAKYQR